MSWSVSYCGTPAQAKIALASQFEASRQNTENIRHEHASVSACEDLVNTQLDFLRQNAPTDQVYVTAGGAAAAAPEGAEWKSYSTVSVSIQQYVPVATS